MRGGTLLLSAAAVLRPDSLFADDEKPMLRVALITDLHHADKKPVGNRHYRETTAKLAEATAQFEMTKPDFIVELGDLIDAADSPEVELAYLSQINTQFSKISEDRHYVLGNHCVDMLTKQEFLERSLNLNLIIRSIAVRCILLCSMPVSGAMVNPMAARTLLGMTPTFRPQRWIGCEPICRRLRARWSCWPISDLTAAASIASKTQPKFAVYLKSQRRSLRCSKAIAIRTTIKRSQASTIAH